MNLVVLDGYTANPGDLDWDAFAALGALTVHDRTPTVQIVERARDAEIVLTNKAPLDAGTIAALPRLRYIGVLATGYNIVDIAAARARDITVCNVPEYGTANVAQAVFALILELTSRTGHHADTVRAGRWSACIDWCYWDFPLIELSGRTLGIIGYGRIGAAVARIGAAFGMKVLAHRRSGIPAGEPAQSADLDTIFREVDVLTLHCPLTPETKHLIDSSRLAQMKPTSFLINTARGPLVDEPALAAALDDGRIAGAGLDVLSAEPPAAGNPLLSAKNCLITPHIAWATREARSRLLAIAAENIRAWQSGTPRNVVN
ncbi:MAG: D-2-hydroxyacid dehydrogenase [Chthoniobacteraceae bacterium]